MSLEHNFYRTNEICYQGKAGQVHQLKKSAFFPLSLSPHLSSLPSFAVNGPELFKMIDFIISSFIKVLRGSCGMSNQDNRNWLSTNVLNSHFSVSCVVIRSRVSQQTEVSQ